MGCGKPIVNDYKLTVYEIFKDKRAAILKFHGWECLAEFMIDRGMVAAEVVPCE